MYVNSILAKGDMSCSGVTCLVADFVGVEGMCEGDCVVCMWEGEWKSGMCVYVES